MMKEVVGRQNSCTTSLIRIHNALIFNYFACNPFPTHVHTHNVPLSAVLYIHVCTHVHVSLSYIHMYTHYIPLSAVVFIFMLKAL